MMPRICPVCGIQQSADATVCPRCSQTLPNRGNPIPLNLQQEHLKLYEFLMPAAENPEMLSAVKGKMERCLEKYRTLLSYDAYRVLKTILYDAFQYADDRWGIRKEVNRQNAQAALNSINYALNRQSTYEGLGFSVITDSVGAVTYAAMDAIQGHIHDVTRSAAAYKAALNRLSSLSMSSDDSDIVRPIFEAIDRVIRYLAIMVEGKRFVEEHRELYASLSSDTKVGGKRVSDVLRAAARSDKFLGWIHDSAETQSYQKLEAAGYIHLFFARKGALEYYCTTGKLEAEVLQAGFLRAHPQIAASEKKALAEANKQLCTQSENALKKGEYYRAATRYAQAAGDRNALRRSIRIWNEHLMQLPKIQCGYLLGADGKEQSIYTSLSMDIPYDGKLREEGVKYRSIHPCGDRQYVGLSLDGRVYSSAENIYGDIKPSRSELGTAYLPGNGSDWTNITALACSGKHLVGLQDDGTVCAVGCNTKGQCNLAGWTEIAAVEAAKESTAAIKKDGSVLLAGSIAEYTPEVSKWSQIKQLYLREEGLIGLRTDGQVVVAGKTGFDNQVIARWRSIVRIDWFLDGIFAISEAGDISCVSSDPLTEILCRNLSGIVRIVHYQSTQSGSFEKRPSMIALRADGTAHTTGVDIDVSDWSQIVYMDYHQRGGPNLLALTANGEFLLRGFAFQDTEPKEKPFSHIDSYAQQQRQALKEVLEHKKMLLAKAKGLFAGKRRKDLQNSIDFLQNALALMDAQGTALDR